jgi:acyl-CoA synthetase (AMP-forming)/AMP-acid ligase II
MSGHAARVFTSNRKGASTPGKVGPGGFDRDAGVAIDMIISGGVNIYPREVEEVLIEHPDVVDVAMIGRPRRTGGRAWPPSSYCAPVSTSMRLRSIGTPPVAGRIQGSSLVRGCRSAAEKRGRKDSETRTATQQESPGWRHELSSHACLLRVT